MEQNVNGQVTTETSRAPVCVFCHQPILSQYYFCPNCGEKINLAPLSTTPLSQAWIYIFSIVLPMIFFIFITKWPGVKYYKSKDKQTHLIGQIAIVLIILSTILTIYFGYVWTERMIQSSIDSVNTDFGGL